MSIWKVAPAEDTESSDAYAHNTIAWDQLLNNLDLQTSSSDSSDDGKHVNPQSHASTLSEGKFSIKEGRVKPRSSSVGSRAAVKQHKSPTGPCEDDGYSSEDEHDSPENPDSSDSVLAAFRISPGLTATTKIGSTASGNSGSASPSDTSKSYFFVNGVQHYVQDEQGGPNWAAKPPQMPAAPPDAPAAPSRAMGAGMVPPPPPWGAPAKSPAAPVAPLSRTVVASTETGMPAAWVYTPKSVAHTQVPPPSPPRYEAPRGMSSGAYAVPSFLGFQPTRSEREAPAQMPPSGAYYPTTIMLKGSGPAVPAPYTASCAPTSQMTAAPFYPGDPNTNGSAAPPQNAVLGYVYINNEGHLRVVSQTNSPMPPTPSAACPPPPAPLPHPSGASQLQTMRMPSEAAAMYQGASSAPGMSPMQYTATYAADGNMLLPTVPLMPMVKASPAGWGTTKAWMFRDSRWISLSM